MLCFQAVQVFEHCPVISKRLTETQINDFKAQ